MISNTTDALNKQDDNHDAQTILRCAQENFYDDIFRSQNLIIHSYIIYFGI